MDFEFLKDFTANGFATLICTDVNRRYLSGFSSSLGYFLIVENETFLFVDGRYYTAAESSVGNKINVVLLENICEQLNIILKQKNTVRLYLENDITVGLFSTFQKKLKCEVKSSEELTSVLLQERSVKSDTEIELLKKAQHIAEEAFENVLGFIKCGVSESDIALQLDYEMRKRGSEGISFDTICVSGVKSALPHGVPSEKKVECGDFVTMDFGAVYKGYHSDMTRTVAVGYATDEMQKVYNTVLEAQQSAIECIKAGVRCCDVDSAARTVINDANFGKYFNHSTGHGVGLEIHEYPNLSFRNADCLKINQVVTCEPGIYLPDKFGVRIEDMVLVKNNSIQNLTKTTKELIIL